MSYSPVCEKRSFDLGFFLLRCRWATRYASGNDIVKKEIINYALQKLRHCTALPRLKEQRDGKNVISAPRRYADLAALDVCALFDFAQIQASQRFQMELIASHMRVLFFVSERHEYVISGYPSEPILAIAALHHLNEANRQDGRYHALAFVRDAVVQCHIATGTRGEFVARLILILAMCKALHLPNPPAVLMPIQSVSVKEFLKALLPTEQALLEFWSRSPCRGRLGATVANGLRKSQDLFHPFRPVHCGTTSHESLRSCCTRTGHSMRVSTRRSGHYHPHRSRC